jgi:hypothetical protein
MANLNITNIPAPRVPFIDERTGLMAREWYLFFLNLFVLTGSGNNPITLEELQLGPPNQPDLTELLIQINQNIAPQYEDQSGDFLATLDTAQLMSMMSRFENAEAAIQGAYLQPPQLPVDGVYVVGPGSSTDNAVARFDGTSGKLIQNSVTTIDDTGNASGILSQQFSDGAAVTLAAGKMWYDGTTGAWNAGMGNGNITQQIGEEIFVYGKASAAITDSPLQIIYRTGVVGASGVITFAPTIAGITDANSIIGVATESLALNGFGRATVFGVVRGITTNGTAFGEVWADNDVIWYNPVTGNPTKVEPVAPYIKVQVGLVIKAGAGGSGSFQVGIARGSKLGGTDSNVQFGTLANNNLIAYDSAAGYWKNVTASSIGLGTVSSVSVVSANGLAGTVATATTTPAITLSTTVTGVVKGNGTALSAAVAATDYVAPSAYASANGLTMATARLLGRTTASTGAAEEISVAGGLTLSGGTLTGTSGTVTSVTGTSPVVSSGGATPAISMPAATTSVNGYLTSTDWTTFNNKGSGSVTSVSFTGGIITVATATTTPALTVAGTSGGIPYFSSASTWASSAALAAGAIVLGGGAGVTPATTTTGTGVVTALGVNTGTAGAFVVNGGALGTPSSGTVTNLTGTASINTNGAHNGTVGATTANTGAFTTGTFSSTLSATGTILGNAGIRTNGVATTDLAASIQILYESSYGVTKVQGPNAGTVGAWRLALSASDNSGLIYPISAATSGVTLTKGLLVNASGTLFNIIDITDTVDASGATYVQFRNSAGGGTGSITRVTTTNAVTYNTTSDYRLKNNQAPLTGSGAFIDALQPKTWEWAESGIKAAGFIAHEFAEVSPSSVSGEKDGTEEEEYEVSPAIDATLDEDGNELTPAVAAVKATRTVPVYQGMQASSSEVIANLVAEIQLLRRRVAALEAV